jgi:hypothetical protein
MKLRLTDDELGTIERLSDAELAGKVRDGVRKYRATRDAAGSGIGARELEEGDDPPNQDDPSHTPGTPEPPRRMTQAEYEAEFHASDRAPDTVAAMSIAIPNYQRLK